MAILVTISTHKGPQFVLHYPPDPDNHGYQAAPIVHDSSDNDDDDINDDDNNDDDDNDSSSTYFCDTDDVLTDEDSDGDIPCNYDNAKDESGSRRDSDTSMYTASTHTDRHFTRQHYNGSQHRSASSRRKNTQQKLTRSETNPINPIHRTALKEAKVIEGIERAKRNAAAAKKVIEDTSMEDSFAMYKDGTRRRSSMNDTTRPTVGDRSNSGGGIRRHSSRIERPIINAIGSMQVSESAIVDDDCDDTGSISISQNTQFTTAETLKAFRTNLPLGAKQEDTMTISSRGSKKGDNIMDGLHKPPVLSWKTVLGFDTLFLSELLVPSRYLCNKRFELSVDDMAFLGCPVHVLPDGNWVKKKNETPQNKETSSSRLKRKSRASNVVVQEDEAEDEFEEPTYYADGPDEDAFQQDNHADNESIKGKDDTAAGVGQEYDDPKSDMRMFHVVFVLNPPVIEYSFRIEEMYHHIISKFVASLRHEQAKSNYVWNEVSKIMQVRDKASQEGMFYS